MRTTMRRLSAAVPLFLATALPVLAQDIRDDTGLTGTATEAGFVTSTVPFATFVGNLIGGLLGLLGIVFVALVIYAGFTWMTAQDNADKVKAAKKIMTSAVIGLVVTFSAYAIAQAVIGVIAQAQIEREYGDRSGGPGVFPGR